MHTQYGDALVISIFVNFILLAIIVATSNARRA